MISGTHEAGRSIGMINVGSDDINNNNTTVSEHMLVKRSSSFGSVS